MSLCHCTGARCPLCRPEFYADATGRDGILRDLGEASRLVRNAAQAAHHAGLDEHPYEALADRLFKFVLNGPHAADPCLGCQAGTCSTHALGFAHGGLEARRAAPTAQEGPR